MKSFDFPSHTFLDALEVVKAINGDNDWSFNSGILDIRNIIKGCVMNGFSFFHWELILLLSVWLNLNCFYQMRCGRQMIFQSDCLRCLSHCTLPFVIQWDLFSRPTKDLREKT